MPTNWVRSVRALDKIIQFSFAKSENFSYISYILFRRKRSIIFQLLLALRAVFNCPITIGHTSGQFFSKAESPQSKGSPQLNLVSFSSLTRLLQYILTNNKIIDSFSIKEQYFMAGQANQNASYFPSYQSCTERQGFCKN